MAMSSLQRENVGRLPAVLLAPDVAVVAGVDQFGTDFQVIAALHDAALENGANAQRLPNGLGIGIFALVHESGVAGHHLQVGQLGQTVDEALGDAVAQVFRVWIAAGIHEGQHRDRVDCLAAARARPIEPARTRQQEPAEATAATPNTALLRHHG